MYLKKIGSLTMDIPLYLSNVSGSNRNLECWFFRSKKNQKIWKKNSPSKDEKKQQTEPTCDARSGNETWATALRGEHPHHYAIPAFTINRKKRRKKNKKTSNQMNQPYKVREKFGYIDKFPLNSPYDKNQ